ncbi:p01990-2R [African swine fever virus]|nr:p01990-2R [African swine fever virus]AXB49391.1 p01990-2R [African swine fever virus]AXB49565.1 p01990-2R [African swine fever virus]AXB49737.1 p01990-2R [African swine fever virus]AXB49908.1 p01990-2R [African swine fever virus]
MNGYLVWFLYVLAVNLLVLFICYGIEGLLKLCAAQKKPAEAAPPPPYGSDDTPRYA